MKKLLFGSLVINVVLFSALAWLRIELSQWPEPTPPVMHFIFVTNAPGGDAGR